MANTELHVTNTELSAVNSLNLWLNVAYVANVRLITANVWLYTAPVANTQLHVAIMELSAVTSPNLC